MDNRKHPIPPRLLTATELGRELGITGRTILNWEAAGLIEAAVRIGRTVRYDATAVNEKLAELTARNRASIRK